LNWRKPIDLPDGKTDPALKDIPPTPGVYVFFREHGTRVQIFYIGKALRLQSRIKGQLNNHTLMSAISSAKNGRRKLVWAELKNKPGQSIEGSLKAAEKLMIRHFVEEGQPVHNVQGKRIPVQTLTNNRSRALAHFIPGEVTIDA
jgi:hypothetical protein